ncbi:hypothetical protein GGS20DRAFT_536053 [Poronia punctata]|nr:hypothetical protein GGS20DRAFT_536053 [Poronia punctata]
MERHPLPVMADAGRPDAGRPETPPALQPSRIKRNSACTSCRDSKVRCNPSSEPEKPCQRCAKLHLTCVVDKTHKRISRRSKLDELAKEIQSIKQSVGSTSSNRLSQPHGIGTGSLPKHATAQQQQLGGPSPSGMSCGSGSPSSRLSAPRVMNTALLPSTILNTPDITAPQDADVEPSPARNLGSYPFSGEDIDFYFDKFFQHYHPYMPVVRQRDPKKIYETSPLLFWTIIYVSSRRYAKTPSLIQFLSEELRRQVFAAIGEIPVLLPTINAIILICSWLFPSARFINDPSVILSSVGANVALQLGLHTGKGGHPEYSHGMFRNDYTDEEATYTWAGLNIVSQRVSAYLGLPPVAYLFNQTIQNTIDGRVSFHVPSGFRVLLECQKFSNHVNKIILANLEESNGVSTHIVRVLEDEWNVLQGIICSERADDLDRFNALLVQLEIQLCYLVPLPGYHPDALKQYILRVIHTASSVLHNAQELDQKTEFLGHITHFQMRSVVTASCVIFKLLRSSYMRFMDAKFVEDMAAESVSICLRMSVAEGDLARRLASLLKNFLDAYHSPSWTGGSVEEPIVTAFPHRLGASVAFDCLKQWKDDGTMQRAFGPSQKPQQLPNPANESTTQEADNIIPTTTTNDSLGIDWAFLDDLELTFGTNLGPPVTWWQGMA